MPSERVCYVCFDPAEVSITVDPLSHEKAVVYYLCYAHFNPMMNRLTRDRNANLKNADKRSASRANAGVS